jgi:NDP-sugar pyrophosphorylase family protein
VLVAGLGLRLRPLSLVRAKAAVPVAGEPLIRRILTWLARSGLSDVVLNLHHKPDTITRLVGDGADLGLRVRYSWENPVLGSAGGPRRALPLLDADRFLIVNGDTLTDVDLGALCDAHAASGRRVTMAVIPNPAPDRYGGVAVGGDGRVLTFTRRSDPAGRFHFVGAQVVEARVFESLDDGVPAESVGGLYRSMIQDEPGVVGAFVSEASFYDVGTVADYLATSLALARAEGHGEPPAGRGTSVHPGARVTRTVLWDDVTVEAGCDLTECIVTDGARVKAGTLARGCVVRAPEPGAGGEPVITSWTG